MDKFFRSSSETCKEPSERKELVTGGAKLQAFIFLASEQTGRGKRNVLFLITVGAAPCCRGRFFLCCGKRSMLQSWLHHLVTLHRLPFVEFSSPTTTFSRFGEHACIRDTLKAPKSRGASVKPTIGRSRNWMVPLDAPQVCGLGLRV